LRRFKECQIRERRFEKLIVMVADAWNSRASRALAGDRRWKIGVGRVEHRIDPGIAGEPADGERAEAAECRPA